MSWVMKIPWRRKWLPTSVFLPGKFHGQRTLVGYSPWGHKESDMNERLTFSLSFKILKMQEGIGQFNHHILFTILRIYDTSSVKNAVFQKFLFIYFCLCWVFLMLHAIVLQLRELGFSLQLWLLIVVASLALECWLQSVQAPVVVAHRLNCPVAHGVLVPRPGIQPVSPALAGS